MATTLTNRELNELPVLLPTLRLVFSGERVLCPSRLTVLHKGPTLIGREVALSAGLCLASDPQLSRTHAQVHVASDASSGATIVRIADVGSKNGTFVNGLRVTDAILQDGDIVRVGDSFMVFRLERPIPDEEPHGYLLGHSPAIASLRRDLVRVASSAAEILLVGESGSGKELAAQTIHELRQTQGRRGPFIAVNCAAIPETLAESLLFGHCAGAFSDAKTSSEGYFRAADGGTLFLDEVGDMPLAVQAKLLRALEQGEVRPLGSPRGYRIDIRLIAATNVEIRLAVQEQRFRGDLYMRLAALPITLPPLRARREDILHLLARLWTGQLPSMTPRLVNRLLLYAWPFNVRELLKVAADLATHARSRSPLDLAMIAERLDPADTQSAVHMVSAAVLPPLPLPTTPSRDYVEALLTRHGGVVERAAREAGRDAKTIRRWLAEYDLELSMFRLDRKGKG